MQLGRDGEGLAADVGGGDLGLLDVVLDRGEDVAGLGFASLSICWQGGDGGGAAEDEEDVGARVAVGAGRGGGKRTSTPRASYCLRP